MASSFWKLCQEDSHFGIINLKRVLNYIWKWRISQPVNGHVRMTLDLTDFQDLAKPVTFEMIFHALKVQTATVFIRFWP